MPIPIPANAPLPIIIAGSSITARAAPVARPFLAVIPIQSDWNDFGLYTSVDLRIYPQVGEERELGLSLLIQGSPRTDTYLTQLLGQENWRPLTALELPFCSVLSKLRYYKEIVEILGFARTVTVLRYLGDAVVLRLEGGDEQRLALLESPEFYQSVLRSDAAFVAYRRGARYLRPQPYNLVEDSATSFGLNVRLPPADNNYEITFDFEPDQLGRNRAFVLIGKNGAGKTQLLLSIIEELRARALNELPVNRDTAVVQPPSFNRLLVFSSVVSDPYPREIPPWDGVDYAYYSMIGGASVQQDALTTSWMVSGSHIVTVSATNKRVVDPGIQACTLSTVTTAM